MSLSQEERDYIHRHHQKQLEDEIERVALQKELDGLKAKIGHGDLDDEIHEIFSRKASDTNNEGVTAQVDVMVGVYGLADTIQTIKDILL